MNVAPLVGRYQADLASDDPIRRAVARHQLGRLRQAERRRPVALLVGAPRSEHVSPWQHVDLAELFAEHGNRVFARGEQDFEAGHEPHHSSKSGRCVYINGRLGKWFCRACNQQGDAASYIMAVRGCDYRAASAWLSERYGPARRSEPTPSSASKPRRRLQFVEA